MLITLLGYVKPHPDHRSRGSSSSLNAYTASNSERTEKVNHGTARCYGCHRPGHSGDSCYKKGEPGFNTNKDIPWSESPNGKILMSMGFKVLGGNRPSNRDASGKAPFWKKARKQLCEYIYMIVTIVILMNKEKLTCLTTHRSYRRDADKPLLVLSCYRCRQVTRGRGPERKEKKYYSRAVRGDKDTEATTTIRIEATLSWSKY